MTQKEQTRLQVLNSLMADHMTLEQAATLMGVSARHTRRILAAYSKEGAAALAHGHRGRRAPNATPEPLRSEVLRLAGSRYLETNHTHLNELLREREGIEIGRTTLRRILAGAGLQSPRRRRPPKHRIRRQRMPREGMLIQVDGSHHRWLGDEVPPFALLLAVDDATGIVVNALFCEQENTRDYFLLMRGLIQRHGIPIALYTDRHSVFKNVPGSGLARAPTQFSRAMDELGVQMVFALSPQAKGTPPPAERQDDDPEEAPRPARRLPGTFPRQIAHRERIEYSYDPGTGQFAANRMRSSKPVVTAWDPSMPDTEERLVGNWEVTPERNGVFVEMGESAAPEVPKDVQAQLRQRAEQEGGPVSASAFVRFSHDLATRETETRVSLPKRDAASRAAAMSAAGGGSASGELNPKYQRAYDGMQEQQQQSRANERRGGGRRRDDLKDGAYKMPQIVIEQEPTSFRRVG